MNEPHDPQNPGASRRTDPSRPVDDTREFAPVPPDFHPGPGAPQHGSAPYAAPGQQPPPQPPRKKRRVGLIVSLTAAALVLIVVIAGVGSELYLRNNVKNCLQQSFGSITGTSTSVSLSKTPMLWQWATGTVPSVQVDTNDSSGDTSAMKLHVKAEDLKNNDQGSTAKSIQGNGYLPFSRITDMSATQNSSGSGTSTSGTSQSGATITSLTGNAAAGTVTVKANASVLILDVPVTAELKPQLQNGKITFQAVKLSAFGIGVPSNIAQVIIDGLRSQLFPPLFDALNFQSLKVTDSGVEFVVDGTDVPLNSQTTGSSNTQSNSSSGACAA